MTPIPSATTGPSTATLHRLLIAALVVVVAWAGTLRFVGITRSRLLLCDEAYYLLEARRLVGQVRACELIARIWHRDRPAGLMHLSAADQHEVEALAGDGYGQIGGRFGHDALLALGLLAGLPEEWCGQVIAALFGLATVLLVVAWATRAGGLGAGLTAGALLGGSVIHLAYSRSVLCESDTIFCVTAALACYASALTASTPGRRAAWTLTAGFSFGLAFVCNMRAVPVIYGLLAFEALALAPRRSLPRLALFSLAATVPLALAEAAFHVLFLFSGAAGVLLTRQTYLHSILWQFSRLQGGVMAPGTNLGQYARYFVALESPLAILFYITGVALLARRSWRAGAGSGAERLLLIVILVLCGYWEWAVGFKCLRYISQVLPLLALAAGLAATRGVEWVAARAPRLAGPVWLALVLVVVGSSSLAWRCWQGERPGYREVADWLAAQPHPRIVATQANYFRLYFPTADVEIAQNLDQVKDAHARGFRWYVDCFQKYHWPSRPELLAVEKQLARTEPRCFPHPMAGTPFNWYECGLADVPPDWNADAATIRVWDLNVALRPTPGPTAGL